MTLSNDEAIASRSRRDRSYSDAHALLYSEKKNSSDITMDNTDTETIITPRIQNNNPIADCTTKRHHHHHHDGNRPRSKSLDLHRHSTPVHKKKYPYKYIPPRPHSPGVGCPSASGRISPSTPKLKGKMWIRPDATRNISQGPFLPALASVSTARYPSFEEQCTQVENTGFIDMDMPSLDHSMPPTRQVTNASSPNNCPTSFGDGMMLYSTSPNSSSDLYQRQGGHHDGPSRIIFGENGRPIKSRSVFGHYTPTTTTAL